MTNKELYTMLRRLGMVDQDIDDTLCCFLDDTKKLSKEDNFQNNLCKDIVSLTNFVDDLCINNDINCIKKFLVCAFFENNKESR